LERGIDMVDGPETRYAVAPDLGRDLASRTSGIAVNTGARIAALAGPREILVSRTVVDLVSGSAATFEDRGSHHLKGVPGAWQLFAVQ
jgi:class 3 adenylate cyclase